MKRLNRSWWLLVACGVLEAAYAVLNLLTQAPDGSFSTRHLLGTGTWTLLCIVAVAAGACSAAAGLWVSPKPRKWLLLMNGAALLLFGLIPLFIYNQRVSFLPFAMLLVMMAVSIGLLARTLHSIPFGFAGVVAAAFAVCFLVTGFGLVRLEPWWYFSLMSSFFGFCALFLLGLATRPKSLSPQLSSSL